MMTSHFILCNNLLSSLEGQFVVLLSIAPVQLLEVERLGEEVVNEGAESDAVSPAAREVLDLHSLRSKTGATVTNVTSLRLSSLSADLVVPDPALAPDENRFHLGRHHLHASRRSDDAQLHGDSSVSRHATAFGVAVGTKAVGRH